MKNSAVLLVIMGVMMAGAALAQPGAAPCIGRYALDLPGGGAGWIEIKNDQGFLDGSVLWAGGSVLPFDGVYFQDGQIIAIRNDSIERKDAAGTVIRTQIFPETFTMAVKGDEITGTRESPNGEGTRMGKLKFAGKRIPPLPEAPDLANLRFDKPISLLNDKDLEGWELTSNGAVSGWRVENGVLINEPRQEEGKPHVNYGNLRTKAEFNDFNLKLEVNLSPDGNSGVYLRGIYEVQMLDSFGKPLDSHNMGGIYSRICPASAAEKPAGEWQTVDITLAQRHVSVILNGVKIIDNQPLPGCTGGALWSDEFKPGPIYLQGDHTGVQYRNIVLTPIAEGK